MSVWSSLGAEVFGAGHAGRGSEREDFQRKPRLQQERSETFEARISSVEKLETAGKPENRPPGGVLWHGRRRKPQPHKRTRFWRPEIKGETKKQKSTL